MKAYISSEQLRTRNYSKEESCDYIHGVICRHHLSWGVLNASLQLKPYQKNCKEYFLTTSRKLRIQTPFKF